MANKTYERRLVVEAFSLAPPPDHTLVVFKAVGAGRRFHACLAPGERFKKGLLESASSFFAYAVPRDDQLRHRFSLSFRTHDQAYAFTLHLTLDYRVADPASLVDKVDSDPLGRIEEETETLLRAVLKGVDWSLIDREPHDLGELLFYTTIERDGAQVILLEWIRTFAARYGLAIRRIQVERDLPSEEVKTRERLAEVAREQDLRAADQLLRRLDKHHEHELRQLGQHHEHEISRLEQRHSIELELRQGAFNRSEQVMSQIAAAGATAAKQSIESVHSPAALASAMRELVSPEVAHLAHAVGTSPLANPTAPSSLTIGSLPLTGGRGLAAPSAEGRLLAAPGASTTASLLVEINRLLAPVGDDPDLRQLHSAALHLVAEAVRGTEADAEELARRRAVLSAHTRSLIDRLERDQIELLRRLQRPDLGIAPATDA